MRARVAGQDHHQGRPEAGGAAGGEGGGDTATAPLSRDSSQVQDGADYRVLISPLPPIKEEAKEEVEAEEEVKTVVKEQRKVSIKKVVKVEVKSNGLDER